MAALQALHSLLHGTVLMVDQRRLLAATYHFNPTIASDGQSVWMMYRCLSPDEWLKGPRTLGLCRLDRSLQPDLASNLDLSARIVDPPGADRWHADPRLFFRGERLWFSYHDNYSLFLSPLVPLELPRQVHPQGIDLIGRQRRERERNWGFFDDGTLQAVYTIRPHVVLKLGETPTQFAARVVHETDLRLPWNVGSWGEPHGGSMPHRVGQYWYAFFQSASYDQNAQRRHYYVGFYGFENSPPYAIKLMSRRPVLDASDFAGDRSFYLDWSVVYAAGAIFYGGKWLVALGIHDKKPALAVFDHATLLRDCAMV